MNNEERAEAEERATMTPEEARDIIKNMLNLIELRLSAEQNQALSVAVDALERWIRLIDFMERYSTED